MFVWQASTILSEIQRYLPEVARIIDLIIEDSKQGMDFQQAVEETLLLRCLPYQSITVF